LDKFNKPRLFFLITIKLVIRIYELHCTVGYPILFFLIVQVFFNIFNNFLMIVKTLNKVGLGGN